MRLTLLLAALAVALPGCFEPDQPPCAFACGDNGACPEDYQCLADGYCHLHGMPGSCGFSDLSATADMGVGDLSMTDGPTSTDGPMSTDGAATMDLSTPDLSMPDLAGFMSLQPCPNPGDYTLVSGGTTTVSFGNIVGLAYSPRCLAVHQGTVVTFAPAGGGTEDFSTHPLTPSTRGTMPNPIPQTTSNPDGGAVDVTFATAGFYPYYCAVHGTDSGSGMAGVVQVLP